MGAAHLTHADLEAAVRDREPILPGWHLFPVVGKTPPRVPAGVPVPTGERGGLAWPQASAADPGARAVLAGVPHDGWAVATGPSRLLVVDLDEHAGQASGMQSWCRFLAEHDVPPSEGNPRIVGATPTGGRHLYYANTPGAGNRAGILPGVDLRGMGGYVAVTGPGRSLTITEWAFTAPPAPLAALLAPVRPAEAPRTPTHAGSARSRLDGILSRLRAAQPGERNTLLHWAGCRLREMVTDGTLTDATARALLLDEAERLGLSTGEAEGTARSALRGGAR